MKFCVGIRYLSHTTKKKKRLLVSRSKSKRMFCVATTTFLTFLLSSRTLTLVLKRRKEEYRIILHSQSFELERRVQQLEQTLKEQQEIVKEQQKRGKEQQETIAKLLETVTRQEENIAKLLERESQGEKGSILSLATTIASTAGSTISWNVERIPLVHPFVLSEDKKTVSVEKKGTFLVYASLLAPSGAYFQISLKVNDKQVLYGYSGAPSGMYNDTQLLTVVELNEGDKISIYDEYNNSYNPMAAYHSSFVMVKL